ncbi:hypothetical protein RGUI_2831 [Rhodovulum sp. P5]|nr:hypothetical protein RGUI_2831 [Rhodovulum sp. P5]
MACWSSIAAMSAAIAPKAMAIPLSVVSAVNFIAAYRNIRTVVGS